jgi:hypothetical protein
MSWVEMRGLLTPPKTSALAQAGAVLNSIMRAAGRVFQSESRAAITMDDIFEHDGLVPPR